MKAKATSSELDVESLAAPDSGACSGDAVEQIARPAPRWALQYRLRTAIGVMLVFAIWMGWQVRQHKNDLGVMTVVKEIDRDAEGTWTNPFWLPTEGRTVFSRVTRLSLDVSRDQLEQIPFREFSRLRSILLICEMPDTQLEAFSERVPNVEIEWVLLDALVEENDAEIISYD